MPLKQTNIAGGAIKAAFVVQEGVADAHERVFTAGQLGQAAKIGDTLASFIGAARSSTWRSTTFAWTALPPPQ
jgi:uncharacterized membrane protein